LFALLFMSSEVAPNAIPNPADRIRLLRPYYGLIGPAGFSNYFAYSFVKAVESIGKLQHWTEAMLALEGCRLMSWVAESIALVAVTKLKELAIDNARIIGTVIDYMEKLSAIVKTREKEKDGKRFYRFVLDGFAAEATESEGVRVFHDFYLRDWYDARRRHFSSPVALSMKQALNCALGEWYRHHRWRDETGRLAYLELVNSLAESPEGSDRDIAVYLIRQSEATWGREDVQVRNDFQPALRALKLDAALVSEHSELFRVNIVHDL
jgi:hypothetical protein